jgi:predicted SprT family Zn-dependent metalloprotease
MAGLIESEKLAKKLMRKHGLLKQGWSFKWDHAKRRYGCCNYTEMTIQLSKYLTRTVTIAEVEDTILHEIAHALVGPGYGHGWEWKEMCMQIGAVPERCKQAEENGVKVKQLKPNYSDGSYRKRANSRYRNYYEEPEYYPTYKKEPEPYLYRGTQPVVKLSKNPIVKTWQIIKAIFS